MDSTVVAAIVGGVAGVATGGISSVIAPWANWGVEKRQLRRQERVTQIAGWRDVARMYPDRAKLLLDGRDFSLRPHPTPQEREAAEALEQGRGHGDQQARFEALLGAIDRVEGQLGLR